MADCIFFFTAHLSTGLVCLLIQEYRVVPESTITDPLAQNSAPPDSFCDDGIRIIAWKRDHRSTVKATTAMIVRNVSHLFEQKVEILFVRGIFTSISCRAHARPATEGVNRDARIIGHRRQSGLLCRMARFQEGIFHESLAGLFRRFDTQIGLRNDVGVEIREQFSNLPNLPGVAAGENYFFQ